MEDDVLNDALMKQIDEENEDIISPKNLTLRYKGYSIYAPMFNMTPGGHIVMNSQYWISLEGRYHMLKEKPYLHIGINKQNIDREFSTIGWYNVQITSLQQLFPDYRITFDRENHPNTNKSKKSKNHLTLLSKIKSQGIFDTPFSNKNLYEKGTLRQLSDLERTKALKEMTRKL
jgi:hypothetical protein